MNQLILNDATLDLDVTSLEGKAQAQRELELVLMRSLTAYVVIRKKDPLPDILHDLFLIEAQAGVRLGKVIPNIETTDLRGMLAGILTFIPISTQEKPKSDRIKYLN